MDSDLTTNSWPLRPHPFFIAFEGLDGSGKSTLARRTAELSGARFMTTPSPEVRGYRDRFLADLGSCQEARQLFYLATVFSAASLIESNVAAGESVVIDRYFLSTQAYAQFRGSRLEVDHTATLLYPAHLTIYVDAPLPVRRNRLARRGASEADLETLTHDADARLRSLHMGRRHFDVVGEFMIIDSAELSVDECVEQIRLAIWRVANKSTIQVRR